MSDENQIITKVPLSEPIKQGETEITEVTVRRPSPGECRGLNLGLLMNGDVNEQLKIFPRITIPPLLTHELEAMALCDFVEMGEALTNFLYSPSRKAALFEALKTQ